MVMSREIDLRVRRDARECQWGHRVDIASLAARRHEYLFPAQAGSPPPRKDGRRLDDRHRLIPGLKCELVHRLIGDRRRDQDAIPDIDLNMRGRGALANAGCLALDSRALIFIGWLLVCEIGVRGRTGSPARLPKGNVGGLSREGWAFCTEIHYLNVSFTEDLALFPRAYKYFDRIGQKSLFRSSSRI
jgi:hypothetical protein